MVVVGRTVVVDVGTLVVEIIDDVLLDVVGLTVVVVVGRIVVVVVGMLVVGIIDDVLLDVVGCTVVVVVGTLVVAGVIVQETSAE